MKVTINAEKLKRIIAHIDKVCGSVEPINRLVGISYDNGYLTLYGSDGCFTVKAKITEMNPTSLKFSISLDILKYFISELKGNVFIYSDGNFVTFKVKEENLKLRVGKFRFEKFEDRFDVVSKVSSIFFTKDLDFATSHIEEGCMVDIFFNDKIKIAAEYKNIICYTSRDVLESYSNISWSIPYYSARHIVKSLKDTSSKDLIIGKSLNHMVIKGDFLYNLCGEEIVDNKLFLVEKELKESALISKLSLKHLKHYLRRSMMLGRNSQVKLSGTKRGIFFYTFSRGMEYKGMLEGRIESSFSTIANAYFLRSALNRIGGENLLLMLSKTHLIITTSQKKRFILLPLI
ncbi:hypothetical protein [Thermosipho atlanticus]|uniref:DNA polymerase-3 subunit beta n=1 Tax=Thermosipho atlanticus DSM 15807 TaxID=1123380 RepID=A0A1M5RUG0_9BACT|nr:hypothetical protein [Thermosipho atlanticus]SHH29799.1 hypothetical protein SAMN02745199_0625 [Thermosipho atlanticus DSM 15807]